MPQKGLGCILAPLIKHKLGRDVAPRIRARRWRVIAPRAACNQQLEEVSVHAELNGDEHFYGTLREAYLGKIGQPNAQSKRQTKRHALRWKERLLE